MNDDRNLALRDVMNCFLSLSSVRHEVKGLYTPGEEFNAADDFPSHIQGIAKCRESPRFFVTTSAQGGLLIPGLAGQNGYVLKGGVRPDFTDQEWREESGDLHPGGIQTVGEHAVVPIYESTESTSRSEVQTWIYDDAAQEPKCCASLVTLTSALAYCVGITSIGNEYVLAVCVDPKGHDLRIYRGESLLREFSLVATVSTRRRHPNSIALISDRDDDVFLVGLRCGSFRWFGRVGEWLREFTGIGQDKVDLYRLYSDGQVVASDRRGRIRQTGSPRHVKCRRGWERPSFRWGGSACAMSDSEIEVTAVGLQIYRRTDDGTGQECAFEIDLFRSLE